MIDRAIQSLGLDWRYMSFEIDKERLAEALTGVDVLGMRGVLLHGNFRDQGAAAPSQTERAARTGRLTHLTRHGDTLQGDDATGPALVEALQTELGDKGDPAGKRVVLLGANGARPSVADVLIEQGIASLSIADIHAERAAALVLKIRTRLEELVPAADAIETTVMAPIKIETMNWDPSWIEMPEEADWIISTATWPKGDNQRVAQLLTPELVAGQLMIDLGIGSSRSPLLLAAQKQGLHTIDGLPILVAETALALEAWSNEKVDRLTVRDAAEEFLGV